jgi:hypothetical protein
MFPKILSPDVFPIGSFEWAAAILLPGVVVAPARQVICAWCEVVITPGALPASHGMCAPCFDQAVA